MSSKNLIGLVMYLAVVPGCEGFLNTPNPRTVVQVDPASRQVKIYNNKDVDLELKGLEVDLTAKKGKLESLTIHDTASRVREASVEQMLAITEQQKEVRETIREVGAIASAVLPWAYKMMALDAMSQPQGGGLSLQTPFGTIGRPGRQLTPEQIAAIGKILDEPPVPSTQPTSRPN